MKLFIYNKNFHHMNRQALDEMVDYLKIEKVNNIDEAEVVYSPSQPLNTEIYPHKIYIFGPHFSVFPTPTARSISNKYQNAVYIQPSQPTVDTWIKEFGFTNVPVKAFPFPLNMGRYLVSNKIKDTVLLYYKQRDPSELAAMKNFLEHAGVKYELISYGSYKESDFQEKLDRAKYAVWVGRHESQGFALQSALAKDIPILVWSTRLRSQEWGCPQHYYNVKSEVTTVPYWDKTCGIKFHDVSELEESYEEFLDNLSSYSPRKFIEDNLTIEKCSQNFIDLVAEVKERMESYHE
tara:strand:- start:2905 stop:3783 length:879 start_codon:yes stop_codon:yes gene_type:complete